MSLRALMQVLTIHTKRLNFMTAHLKNSVHVWTNEKNHFLVSFEDVKKLFTFSCIDSAINHIWLSGREDAARQLNQIKKASA